MVEPINENKILRMTEVVDRTGLSESSIRRRVADDEFPAPLRLGGAKSRAVGWRTARPLQMDERVDPGLIDASASRSNPSGHPDCRWNRRCRRDPQHDPQFDVPKSQPGFGASRGSEGPSEMSARTCVRCRDWTPIVDAIELGTQHRGNLRQTRLTLGWRTGRPPTPPGAAFDSSCVDVEIPLRLPQRLQPNRPNVRRAESQDLIQRSPVGVLG